MESIVYMLGEQNLLRELLARHVEADVGLSCHIVRSCHEVPEPEPHKRILILVDAADPEVDQAFLDLRYQEKMDHAESVVALYNLASDEEMEREAILRGVKGLFYRSDRLELLSRGVKALLDGQIWLPRRVLARIAMERRKPEAASLGATDAGLTKREQEVLAYLEAGCTNEEIAEKLFISPHTVKTHLYRVYRKIGVENRHRASLWAANNLSGVI